MPLPASRSPPHSPLYCLERFVYIQLRFPSCSYESKSCPKERSQWGLSSLSGQHLWPTVSQVLMPSLNWATHLRNRGTETQNSRFPRPPNSKVLSTLLAALLLTTRVYNSWDRVLHSPIWRVALDLKSKYFCGWEGSPKRFPNYVSRDKIRLDKYRVQLEFHETQKRWKVTLRHLIFLTTI